MRMRYRNTPRRLNESVGVEEFIEIIANEDPKFEYAVYTVDGDVDTRGVVKTFRVAINEVERQFKLSGRFADKGIVAIHGASSDVVLEFNGRSWSVSY